MINHKLAKAAFRTRATSLVVVTTGSASLSSTATGYARASGSFVTDGFLVGMEVVPTGFTATTPGMITAVSALALTIDGGRTVEGSASGRTLAVGLPTLRAFENSKITPVIGRPYILEQWVPGGAGVTTIPRRKGVVHEDGLSVWSWYGIAGIGTDALDVEITALMALFTAGTSFVLGDGSTLIVRGDTTVKRSQVRNIDSWAVVTVTVPWEARTRNSIAA